MDDTTVTGGTPERASQMAEEVVAMMESIRAIKGELYCEAIQSIFTLHNLIGLLIIDNTRIQVESGIPMDQTSVMNISMPTFIRLLVDNMAGVTSIISTSFVAPYAGKEEYAARHEAKAKEMMEDIRMLMKKQDEYNNGGKGK